MDNRFAEFLNTKYFWFQQHVVKRRASVSDFALWLDVAQPSLSQWMRGVGRQPNLENLVKMAARLGAKETFEAAGYLDLYQSMLKDAFGDPRFREVAAAWFDGTLDEREQEYVLEIVRGEKPKGAEKPLTHETQNGGAP